MLFASMLLSFYVSILQSFEHLIRERERSETMIWALRVWGISSAVVLATIFLASMQSWAPAEAVRSSRFDFAGRISALPQLDQREFSLNPPQHVPIDKFTGFLVFQEAPAFRNGIECPISYLENSKAEAICDNNAVHIAMTLDATYLRGSMAAVFSVVKHAACPENIVFHFLVSDDDVELKALMRTTFPYLRFKIYYFDEMLVKSRISLSVRQDLEQPLNYARNYLADIIEPCVQKVIYLDSDLVVVDDIARLWGTSLGSKTLGAPEYCHANFTKYFTNRFWSNRNFSSTFHGRTPCYFNTGVMIMDLTKWRQHNYTKQIELWMDVQKEWRIYELGSLPPFLLVFAGSIEAIEHRWNQHGLGGDNVVGSCRSLHPGPVSLLHWSGKGKPWLRLDSGRPCPLDSLWAPYDLFVDVRRADT